MKNVSDYIAEFLTAINVNNIHTLMGGGASGLNDAFIRHPKINCLCYHHEQSAGYAALGEVRLKKYWSVANVTTGCGGSNIYTPVLNAWQDSLPLVVISGNVPRNTLASTFKTTYDIQLRAYGVQENDIVSAVSGVTKYAELINSPEDIQEVMKQAFLVAAKPRKGPVWIDVPADIQHAHLDSSFFERINSVVEEIECELLNKERNDAKISSPTEHDFSRASRPLILLGGGVSNCPSAKTSVLKFIRETNIPVVATYAGTDVISHDFDKYLGTIGIKGSRAANFAVQNCDLLLVSGSRLPFAAIGYDVENFAKNAQIVAIDPDRCEQKKNKILFGKRLTSVHTTAQDFFDHFGFGSIRPSSDWLAKCAKTKIRWDTIEENISNFNYNGISIYHVMRELNKQKYDDCSFVIDAGSISYVGPTTLHYRENRKFIFSPAQADMGCALPTALGVAASNKNRVICITGDGSFMSNLQELSTLAYHNYNMTIVLLNNSGYLSITNTQKNNYGNNQVYGEHDGRGLKFPNYEGLCAAFDIPYACISEVQDLNILQKEGTRVIEVCCLKEETIAPYQARVHGLQAGAHDMAPFKDINELKDLASTELLFLRK